MRRVAVVGLGPWGLAFLERLVATSKRQPSRLLVEVVQPGTPGSGVYDTDQPDYLILNNPCGQLSLYTVEDAAEVAYGLGFYEWVVREGYKWVGERCLREPDGRAIDPGDYLPRRLMGEYLQWFYRTLVSTLPAGVEIRHHDARAVDVQPTHDGRETVVLSDGRQVVVDHVVLTTGHTDNVEGADLDSRPRHLRPYPVRYLNATVRPGEVVAISGMGLVAFDVIAALTTGRGGGFSVPPRRDRLVYTPSGREPVIYVFSRSGAPYAAKALHGVDPTGSYRPVIFTEDNLARVVYADNGQRRELDFRKDLLPLIFAEMQVRFHCQHAARLAGVKASSALAAELEVAWHSGTFPKMVDDLERVHGSFSPQDHLFPGNGKVFPSSNSYEAWVAQMISDDLDEALDPSGSAVKAAQEITRVLRNDIRNLIEHGGLSSDSYIDFQSSIRGRMNRIEAGPPAMRSQQMLALMEAGVLSAPFGPDPHIERRAGEIVLSSTRLDEPFVARVDKLIRGHLDMPSLANSQDPLLQRLRDGGRLCQMRYGLKQVGSVDLDVNLHPLNTVGRAEERIWVLGVLSEGTRYFTHYLPSPQSRMRAVQDAQRCATAILA